MLYMAKRRPDGIIAVIEGDDRLFDNKPGSAEQWTMANTLTVKSEAEMISAMERGWRKSPVEAIERFNEKEKAIANAAAHRAYEDRNVSDKAKAEIAEAEAEAGMDHVPEIPEKRRGRPRKVA